MHAAVARVGDVRGIGEQAGERTLHLDRAEGVEHAQAQAQRAGQGRGAGQGSRGLGVEQARRTPV